MHRSTRVALFFIAAAVVLAASVFAVNSAHPARPSSQEQPPAVAPAASGLSTTTVRVDGVEINADVAQTQAQLEKGLGGRDSLADKTGMWFVFPYPYQWGIWMKDMKFPIDIVWLDESLKIVTIKQNVSPETYPEAFYPTSLASYVLELPAGTVEKYHFATGDGANVEK